MASDDEELLALGKELLSERDQNSPASATFLLKVSLPSEVIHVLCSQIKIGQGHFMQHS